MTPSDYLGFLSDLLDVPSSTSSEKDKVHARALSHSVAKALARVRSPGLLAMLAPALQVLLSRHDADACHSALLVISVLRDGEGEEAATMLPEALVEPMVKVLGCRKERPQEDVESSRIKQELLRSHQHQLLCPLVEYMVDGLRDDKKTNEEKGKTLAYFRHLFQSLDLVWSSAKQPLVDLREWCRLSETTGSKNVLRDIGLLTGIK